MRDETTTARGRTGQRSGEDAPCPSLAGRARRPAPSRRSEPEAAASQAIRRREVVVQGMRITLPALGFMDRPLPAPERGR